MTQPITTAKTYQTKHLGIVRVVEPYALWGADSFVVNRWVKSRKAWSKTNLIVTLNERTPEIADPSIV